jgi:hypothetical protein
MWLDRLRFAETPRLATAVVSKCELGINPGWILLNDQRRLKAMIL